MSVSCRRARPAWKRYPALLGPIAALCLLVVATPAHATFHGQDGKIAFQSGGSGSEDIFSINPDGSGQTQLTTNPASDLTPAWSPDGTKIAFASNRDGNYEIYTMNANGSGQTRITNNSFEDLRPDWSPDGTKLAFSSNRDGPGVNQEIYTMNVDGTNPVRLTNNSFRDTFPAWSPAGTQIAFQSDRDVGNFDIYEMNADGTGQTDLTNSTSDDERPNWTDFGAIYYDTNSGGAGEIDEIGGGPVTGSFSAGFPYGASLAPSRRKLAFALALFGGSPGIYVCDGSGSCDTAGCFGDSGCSQISSGEYPDWQATPFPGYARPKGATPLRVSLVPAFRPCSAPTSTHGAPLSYPSCSPPAQTSPYLTVGTPDANGAAANSIGSVRLDTIVGDPATPADEADVKITAKITDVRCKAGATPCGAANTAGGDDYTGEVQLAALLQITDKYNVAAPGGGTDPATGATTLQVTVPCGASLTPTSVGSTCAITTTADAVYGDLSTAREGARAVWRLGQVTVYDGGSDGTVSTPGDNSLFEVQGVFVP